MSSDVLQQRCVVQSANVNANMTFATLRSAEQCGKRVELDFVFLPRKQSRPIERPSPAAVRPIMYNKEIRASWRQISQRLANLNWIVGFGKETPALWKIVLRYEFAT
jgi:hypothetical protein